MINTVQVKAFSIIILICAVPVFAQSDPNIVRLYLKEFPHDNVTSGPPNTLPVYVEVATVQPDVEQGIVFTLNIENNSAKTVKIMDPIDRTHISLHGFTRPFCKSLRNTSPDSSICFIRSFSAEKRKAIIDNKKARMPFEAFNAIEVGRNRRLKTVSDIVPWEPPQNQPARTPRRTTPLSETELFEGAVGGRLTLEPGHRFRAILQITRVHANYEAYEKAYDQWLSDYCIPNDQGYCTPSEGSPPRPMPEIIHIPPGKYFLSVSMILFTNNLGSFTPSFDKSVTIQLGEPDISKAKDTVKP